MASVGKAATVFDLCIIGAGMIGSSAAKHAARLSHAVCLIGQNEPDRSTCTGHSIFGCHYDEARITRELDSNTFWSLLASESIRRYRAIEAESGIEFYTENGYLLIGDSHNSQYFQSQKNTGLQNHIHFDELTAEHVRDRFPFMNIRDGAVGLYQNKNSGTLNPRRFVAAQKKLSKMSSCTVIDDVATDVSRKGDGVFQILTKSGVQIVTRKALLCAGAFLFHNRVYPLAIPRLPVTIAYEVVVRVPVRDYLLLHGMPSVISDDFYMLAPCKYPDGKLYVKIGEHTPEKRKFESPEVISDWFSRKIEPERVQPMVDMMCEFLPGDHVLDRAGTQVDTCAFVATEGKRLIIDEIAAGYFVVTGDNGMAAKSADEIGRLASVLALEGRWDCPKFSRDTVLTKLA